MLRRMATHKVLAYIAIAAITFSVGYTTDPTQLQDLCVATNNPSHGLFVNGLFYKNSMDVRLEDFFFKGLDMHAHTNNRLGSNVTLVSATNLPGLNTLGISIARLDFASYGLIAPHTHPRATKVFIVLEGTIYVGLPTSNLPNGRIKLFSKVLNKGDVLVFPQGLIHFQLNVGKTPAAISNSQVP